MKCLPRPCAFKLLIRPMIWWRICSHSFASWHGSALRMPWLRLATQPYTIASNQARGLDLLCYCQTTKAQSGHKADVFSSDFFKFIWQQTFRSDISSWSCHTAEWLKNWLAERTRTSLNVHTIRSWFGTFLRARTFVSNFFNGAPLWYGLTNEPPK